MRGRSPPVAKRDGLVRELLPHRGMHPLSYLQKRGHLSAVALGRQMFAHVKDMTPARFDVLYVIYENSRGHPDGDGKAQMSQARVHRRLGLARQTVWQMVKRLVELGLLEKGPDPDDSRLVNLQLTDEGVRRIRSAYAAAFTERYTVPRDDGGMDAPRHVHALIRKKVEESERAAKRFIRTEIPFTTREWRKTYWGPTFAPPKVGREVAKVFTSLAWRRAGAPARGRRIRSLQALDAMIREARTIAHTLGDQSDLIYPASDATLPEPEPPPPPPRTTDLITLLLNPALSWRPPRARRRQQPRPAGITDA